MTSLVQMLGVLGIAFLIIYFVFKLDKKEHFLLQLLFSFFFIFILFLVPKVLVDNQDTCEIVLANTTMYNDYVYGDNYTISHWDYEHDLTISDKEDINLFHKNETIIRNYELLCFENAKTTNITLLKVMRYLVWCYVAYIFLYFMYVIFLHDRLIENRAIRRFQQWVNQKK